MEGWHDLTAPPHPQWLRPCNVMHERNNRQLVGYQEKRFAKLQSCLMMNTSSFFKLTQIERLPTRNNNMCFAHSFLHLDHSF